MIEYEKAKSFWNDVFKGNEGYETKEKFITSTEFNKGVEWLYDEEDTILDFGCGSGWALPELYFTKKFKIGIGVDQSNNAICSSQKTANLSHIKNIFYQQQDENLLEIKENSIDAIFSCNTLDVIPLEIIEKSMLSLKRVLKNGGKLMISLNPYLDDKLQSIVRMEHIEENMYGKNGILRCVNYTDDEWKTLFEKYFKFVEEKKYTIEGENGVLRRLFFLTKE